MPSASFKQAITARLPVDPHTFILYLHENCLAVMDDLDIDCVAQVSEWFSVADIMFACWPLRDTLASAACCLACRGYMHARSQPYKGSFRQTRKPEYFAVLRQARDCRTAMTQTLRGSVADLTRCTCGQLRGRPGTVRVAHGPRTAPICPLDELATEILPYVHRLAAAHAVPVHHRQILSKLCHYGRDVAAERSRPFGAPAGMEGIVDGNGDDSNGHDANRAAWQTYEPAVAAPAGAVGSTSLVAASGEAFLRDDDIEMFE